MPLARVSSTSPPARIRAYAFAAPEAPAGPAGPAGPAAPAGPAGPCGPGAPAGTWPALKSARTREPFATLRLVTALFLSWAVPTLLFGSVAWYAATPVPVSANISARHAITMDGVGRIRRMTLMDLLPLLSASRCRTRVSVELAPCRGFCSPLQRTLYNLQLLSSPCTTPGALFLAPNWRSTMGFPPPREEPPGNRARRTRAFA